MKKYFLDLFEYNNWANDKLILKLQDLEVDFKHGNPRMILSHVIASQDTWLERVKGKKRYNIYIWEEYSIQELEILSIKSHNSWINFLTRMKEDNFKDLCKYKNSNGERLSRKYEDIFQHVVNHGSYHRGQINQLFRMNGIKPVKIDFIYYC